jgi:uncharacterized SAM-binding protein YcdF (DUF218 family)
MRFRRLRILFTVIACAALAVPARIYFYSVALDDSPFDAAIVLGAATYGAVPSPVFAARLDYAFDLLDTNRARTVILTGGTASAANLTEGEAGRRYLVARGADPERLLVEQRSRTTLENLCFARVLGDAAGSTRYAIISDPLHLRRALLYARDIGLPATPAATPHTRYRSFWPKLKFLMRESYFYARRLLRGPTPCP